MDTNLNIQPREKVLKVEYLPCLNYAMMLNGRKCIEYIEVTNSTEDIWEEVHVMINGELISSTEQILEQILPKQTVRLTNLEVFPDSDRLRDLTETVETSFSVTVDSVNLSQDYPLRLLAFDEWPGIGIMPEITAAFVLPNTPEISRVKISAAAILEKLTGSSALDEYQTQDPNRVRGQVAAIYEALRSEGIVYSAPPASFERTGQRVRLADKVLTEKLGTCMDLSLLMASVLEACGLHSILVLQESHMYVGCWLTDRYHYQSISDDASVLSKVMANGISELVLVEATDLTSSDSVAFEDAVRHAEKHFIAEAPKFILFCDIYRCRLEGIRPLPQRMNGVWQNDGIVHEQATTEVMEMKSYQINDRKEEKNITRQQIWERKLLDFSLRNNLLNIRTGKRVVPFISFHLEQLENNLQEGNDYQILPSPSKKNITPDEYGIYDSRLYREELESIVTEDLKHNRICSYQGEDELRSALKTLFRESRTALEENGANSLFLVFGMLKWFESDKSVRPRYAPLLLLPVDIIRRSGNNYVIRPRDEEITFNTTLVEMLRQQYNVDLSSVSPLPEDEHGIDILQVFSVVRAKIESHAHWDVIEESVLGLFSFNKFVMWNDIHNNAEKMRRSPIIESLLQKHWIGENTEKKREDAPTDMRKIDRTVEPHEFAMPVDVDSSQMEAVVESGEGRSFILYGPPGTGKSQTITNMIANALFHGRRVLFVAEKMAALEVVQKRLNKVGLGPFCLELHSNKVTKSHLLTQLKGTLELTRLKDPTEYEQLSKSLFDQRRELTTYIDLLHKVQDTGLSLYDCISHYESIEGEGIQPSSGFMDGVTNDKLMSAAEKIEALDTVFAITGLPSEHPLQGLNIYDPSQQAQNNLAERLEKISTLIDPASQFIDLLNSTASFKQPQSLNGVRWTLQFADTCQDIISHYGKKILDLDAQQLRAQWNAINAKWAVSRFFAKKSFIKMLRNYRADIRETGIEPLLDRLGTLHRQMQEAGLKALPVLPEAQTETCRELLENVNLLQSFSSFDDENLAVLRRQLPTWLQHIGKSRDWAQWCIRKRELEELRLEKVINHMNHTEITGHDAAQAMLKGAYKYLALQVIDNEPQLQMFNGLLFEDTIKKYRQLAKQFQELTKKMLYCRLATNVPSQALEPSAASELGILKRYIASNGRGATIRHIMDQIPTLLPRLCPVMLMSPISVAQFIDLDQPPFDIVCFDEASQMPTSEAVGAIARGKALICVGDPKQMPPTSFFSTNSVDEDEADLDDMESILDDCITLSLPARYLTWHYRSRHESLIAFSNTQYYEGKLYTFPSVDDRISKVQLIHIDGTYDFGKTRSNRAEAEAIVKEVVRRLNDEELSKLSIGIVSFSKVQQNLIEDLLTDEIAKHADLERRAYDAEEPIFIKNLENVQGDERDVILFSIGYGPDKTGKVSMNFGPLNNQGGERRLNVAVSRARYEMMVFSTLTPEQIDLRRSSALGVAGLKHFLEFARNGRMAVSEAQLKSRGEDTNMIESVSREIRKLGYEVDTFVGRSAFKIDIAILDPKHPDKYALGIICDGVRYHETSTERDREICQPGVLEGLGWKLMRLWSVDWLMNRENVLHRIVDALEGKHEASKTEEKTEVKHVSGRSAQTIQPAPEEAQSLPFSVGVDEIVRNKETVLPNILKKIEKNGVKPIEEINRSDIEKIVCYAVEQQVAIPLEDLKKQASKLLGYPRRTQKIDNTIELAIATLIDRHILTEEAGNITMSHPNLS